MSSSLHKRFGQPHLHRSYWIWCCRAHPFVFPRVGCSRITGYVLLHSRLSLVLISPTGLDCTGRLFISDRAQLVFDFHQIVDGLKEVELGGSRYDTFLSQSPDGLKWMHKRAGQHRNDQEGHRSGVFWQGLPIGPASPPPIRSGAFRSEVPKDR